METIKSSYEAKTYRMLGNVSKVALTMIMILSQILPSHTKSVIANIHQKIYVSSIFMTTKPQS